MVTDSIGGRKFISFLICTFCYLAILYATVLKGIFTGELAQTFLFFLIVIQAIFFGGNVAEKFVMKGVLKDNGTKQ